MRRNEITRGAPATLPGSSPVESESRTYGIYLVLTETERMVIVAASSLDAAEIVGGSAANPVGRLGTFDPGMTGASLVAHSPTYPVLVRQAR